MAQIATKKIQTPSGVAEVPIFEPGDVDGPVKRIQTPNGVGVINLESLSSAEFPWRRVQTPSGVMAYSDAGYTPPDDGGGGGSQTTPTQPPADRVSQGLTIDTTVDILSTSDVLGEANTMYVVDGDNGPLDWDGAMNLGTVDNVAVCGKNGAEVPIPAGYRDYMLTVSDGADFMWSGVDIDQTADGAWGRFNVNTSTNGIIEFVRTIGKGRRANPDPSEEPYSAGTGPTISIPAGDSSGTNHIRNVEFIHGGVLADEHFGDRPIGIFLSTGHNGSLRIERSTFEEFPNNALYATNTTGSVIATDSRFWNNGVTNGRIAFGEFINCTHGYDYQNTGMMNADAPDHGCSGISVDDKGHGTDVDVTGCTVRMVNVAKTGGGIVAQDFGDGGSFGRIEDTDVHIHNAADAADVFVSPNGASVDAIVDCVFDGTADGGVSVDNQGPSISVSGNVFNYPSGRQHYSGPIG